MNKHIGTSLDSLFEELGEKEEVDLLASKKLLAETVRQGMAQADLSQSELAKRMHTSRNQVTRLLDPTDTGVTLATLAKASNALGLRLGVTLATRQHRRRSPARSNNSALRAGAGPRR